jgi:hypothetical protein
VSKRTTPSLPDLDEDDSTFRRKMEPLVEQALPKDRKSGITVNRNSGESSKRPIGHVGAAQAVERIEAMRGAKKRFEYMIPERVGKALAHDAASRGISATTRLLEVLRDSGYPVIPEDLVDLRKLPKR